MRRLNLTKPASTRNIRVALGVALMSLPLASCGLFGTKEQPHPLPTAQSSDQIANVYVSAYPEVPWASISSALAPNRNWKITDAQAVADNTTAAQTSLVSSLLAAGFGISLPTSISSKTLSNSNGKQQTTQSNTQASGTPPTTPTIGSAPALPTTPSLGGSGAISPVDGADLLVASTALFQQAAILDNQINQQYLPLGYSAHLLTFQVNIQPLRRDWAYDAYLDLTLTPYPLGDTKPSQPSKAHPEKQVPVGPPVVIKPLIITDALETASVQDSVQQARQLALELAGTIGTVGASGSLGTSSNSQSSFASYSKNTLVTAGRVSDSTIRIRLGAENSGESAPVLVPRTYNVSLFVLTRLPQEADDSTGYDHSLEAITNVSFGRAVASKTGAAESESGTAETTSTLISVGPARRRSNLAKEVKNILVGYKYPYPAEDCAVTQMTGTTAPVTGTTAPVTGTTQSAPNDTTAETDPLLDTYLDILRAADQGDYGLLKACLGSPTNFSQEAKLHRLVADLERLEANSGSSTTMIPLRDSSEQLPYTEVLSYMTVSSDAQQDTITLPGGRNLRTDHLKARAYVTVSGGKVVRITPSTISFSGDPTPALVLTVPAASALAFASGPAQTPSKARGAAASGGTAPSNIYSAVEVIGNDEGFNVCKSVLDQSQHVCYTNLVQVKQADSSGKGDTSPPKNVPTCVANAVPISTSTQRIVVSGSAGESYQGTLNVNVGDLGTILGKCTQTIGNVTKPVITPPLTLIVSGADVSSGSSTCVALSGSQLQLASTGNCQTTLTLTNLDPSVAIGLTIQDKNKMTVGKQLSLRVTNVPTATSASTHSK